MELEVFLRRILQGELVEFPETMSVIDENYHYHPTSFRNGKTDPIVNPSGQNQGSCKIFAFARLHNLNMEQTLALFGHYYRQDVLANPAGIDHANIRTFMRDGWEGIVFQGEALLVK